MKEEVTHIASAVLQSKSAWFAAFLASLAEWSVLYLPPVAAVLSQLLGITLAIVLIRYHLVNTKKRKIEIRLDLENEELKKQLSKIGQRKTDKQ